MKLLRASPRSTKKMLGYSKAAGTLNVTRSHSALQPDAAMNHGGTQTLRRTPISSVNSTLAVLVSHVQTEPRRLSEGDVQRLATGISRYDIGMAPGSHRASTQHPGPREPHHTLVS